MALGTIIVSMYVTLMPVIFAGVANMRLLKTSLLMAWSTPMDGGKTWRDGRPIFGKNKTWRGAVLMIVCSVVAMVIWGLICRIIPGMQQYNHFYVYHSNSLLFNTIVGFWLGVAYILFELPNSFWKRRRAIEPGQASNQEQPWKYMWLDQMDSLFGCALVVWYYYPMSMWLYLGYVFVGAATHLGINWLLVAAGWKRTI